jgi:hypothetical protein
MRLAVEAKKKALLATLEAVAVAVKTLGLEATEELRAGAASTICRDLSMLSSDVTEGRRAFVAKNRQLLIEVVALASAPDEDFAYRSDRLVDQRFFDSDEKAGSNTGLYLIVKLATSKEHNTIVAECLSLDAKGKPTKKKKKLAYYGAESEEDFNGLLEMIKAYPNAVAAAQEAASKRPPKRKAASANSDDTSLSQITLRRGPRRTTGGSAT